MSIFGSIRKAIFGDNGPLGGAFGGKPAAEAHPAGPVPGQATTAPAAPPARAPAAPPPQGSKPLTPASPTPAAPAPASAVDVEAILTDLAAKSGRPSNWRTSIVDLMTLLGLDSSRANRTELAHELGYTGSTEDSATMNIWLHKQVMRKLAENGGKVPAALTD